MAMSPFIIISYITILVWTVLPIMIMADVNHFSRSIEARQSPIKDFRLQVNSIIKKSESEENTNADEDLYLLFIKYTNSLRDYYIDLFRSKSYRSVQHAKFEAKRSVDHFNATLHTSIPESKISMISVEVSDKFVCLLGKLSLIFTI